MVCVMFFFFNDTATTEIYTLSLHDALPIFDSDLAAVGIDVQVITDFANANVRVFTHRNFDLFILNYAQGDRKSTRLNSSHANISYAVFCLKKKKNTQNYSLQVYNYY